MKTITNLQDINSIEVIFASTTNLQFKYIAGKQGTITFNNHVIEFVSTAYYMHTSYIKKLEIKNNMFIFTTRNSVYSFKPLASYEDTVIEIDQSKLEEQLKQAGY